MKLHLEKVKKSFEEKEVLNGATFTFERGQIYGLLGRNGAGKTTLFNCISKEIDFEEGEISLVEEDQTLSMNFEQIGYAFSTPVLPEFLTGYEFIKFFLDINQKRLTERKSIEEYADMVCLEKEDLDRLVKGYSHGMKNKLQMLCLLIAKPPVLLLDEPLTSLDVVAAHEMKMLLKEMKKDHIIILSTHILQLAQDLCDEIVLLHQGCLSAIQENEMNSEDFEDKIMELLSQQNTLEQDNSQQLNEELDLNENTVKRNQGVKESGCEQGDVDPYEF